MSVTSLEKQPSKTSMVLHGLFVPVLLLPGMWVPSAVGAVVYAVKRAFSGHKRTPQQHFVAYTNGMGWVFLVIFAVSFVVNFSRIHHAKALQKAHENRMRAMELMSRQEDVSLKVTPEMFFVEPVADVQASK